MQNARAGTKARRHAGTRVQGRRFPSVPPCLRAFVPLVSLLLFPGVSAAAPTQEDVFKSIQENVGSSNTDYRKLLPFLAAGGGLVVLLALLSQRRKQERKPRPLNHQGKLVKEVMKTVPLRAAELKQLRLLAEEGRDGPLKSPLTLVLCPSLLADAIRRRHATHGGAGVKGGGKLDRKAVLQLVRKMGMVAAKKTK
jgi:hypothetical protein